MVQQGRRLCPAVLGLKVGRSSLGQGSGSQSWKLLGLWRGALKLGLELQLLHRGTLGLGVRSDKVFRSSQPVPWRELALHR